MAEIASPQVPSSSKEVSSRAGFLIRTTAVLVDVAILLPVWLGLWAAFWMIDPAGVYVRWTDLTAWVILLAYTSTEMWYAGTPGKLILGLRIRYPDGAPADGWTLLLRWSTKWMPWISWALFLATDFVPFYLISGFTLLFVTIGCLYASTDLRQAWHDQWSHTAVYHGPTLRT